MKKCFLVVCLTFVIGSFSVSASDFLMPTLVDVRSSGMGGRHLCDFSQPFILFHNPSGLPANENKFFFPSLGIDVGGPPNATSVIFDILKPSDNTSMTDSLVSLITKNNGLFIDADIMLPLTFSFTDTYWGVGFYNNIFVRGKLPSVSSVSVMAGGDLLLIGGGGLPIIRNESHLLTVGLSTKLLGRFSTSYKGTATDVVAIDFTNLPVDLVLASGFDIGVSYRLFNIVSISVLWKDLYVGMNRNLGTISSMGFSEERPWSMFWQRGDLSLGLGFQIPLGIVQKVVSSLAVYVDYTNVTQLFVPNAFLPHPLLNISAGLEAVIFKTIALRFGMSGPYLSAGAGIDLDPFHISMAVYGKEMGLDPGLVPQVHGAFALSFYY